MPTKKRTKNNTKKLEALIDSPVIVDVDASVDDLNALIKLRHSEEMLAHSQKTAHLGSWELDHVSGLLTWSKEIYRIFGVNHETYTPSYSSFLSHIHPDDYDLVANAFEISVANRQPYDIEHRIILENGSVCFLREMCETTYSEHGQPIKSNGTVQDITEKKQMEIALHEEMEKLERFNKMAIGRELRMVELKKEVNALLQEANREARYVIHDVEEMDCHDHNK